MNATETHANTTNPIDAQMSEAWPSDSWQASFWHRSWICYILSQSSPQIVTTDPSLVKAIYSELPREYFPENKKDFMPL